MESKKYDKKKKCGFISMFKRLGVKYPVEFFILVIAFTWRIVSLHTSIYEPTFAIIAFAASRLPIKYALIFPTIIIWASDYLGTPSLYDNQGWGGFVIYKFLILSMLLSTVLQKNVPRIQGIMLSICIPLMIFPILMVPVSYIDGSNFYCKEIISGSCLVKTGFKTLQTISYEIIYAVAFTALFHLIETMKSIFAGDEDKNGIFPKALERIENDFMTVKKSEEDDMVLNEYTRV